MAKNRDDPWKNDPYLGNGKLFAVLNFFGIAPGILMICPLTKKIAIPKQKIDFWVKIALF